MKPRMMTQAVALMRRMGSWMIGKLLLMHFQLITVTATRVQVPWPPQKLQMFVQLLPMQQKEQNQFGATQ